MVMSEHDALHALSGLIDDPVAPRPAFAEELRSRLIAELSESERNQGKERSVLNLTSPSVMLRLPEPRKRTSRQRLVMAFEIAAVAALMIGLIAALSPARWGGSEAPTPASNSIQAMVPNSYSSPAASPERSDSVLWRQASGGAPDTSVVSMTSGDEKVFRFVQSEQGFSGLEAFDGQAGARAWRFPMTSSWGGSGVTFGDGKVFVYGATSLDDSGQPKWELYALDSATGAQLWATGIPNFASPPIYSDGAVYILDSFHTMTAIDAKSGTQNWNQVFPDTLSMLSVHDGRVYVWVLPGKQMQSFSVDDPTDVDVISMDSSTYMQPPAVVDGKLIVVSSPSFPRSGITSTSTITAFDIANNYSKVWSREYQGTVGAPVVLNEALVVSIPNEWNSADFNARNVLARIDPKTGDLLWESSVASAGFGALSSTTSPVNMILAPSAEKVVYGSDPYTGNEIWAVSDVPA
jgi:outer membrane protein assembly factor BamB